MTRNGNIKRAARTLAAAEGINYTTALRRVRDTEQPPQPMPLDGLAALLAAPRSPHPDRSGGLDPLGSTRVLSIVADPLGVAPAPPAREDVLYAQTSPDVRRLILAVADEVARRQALLDEGVALDAVTLWIHVLAQPGAPDGPDVLDDPAVRAAINTIMNAGRRVQATCAYGVTQYGPVVIEELWEMKSAHERAGGALLAGVDVDPRRLVLHDLADTGAEDAEWPPSGDLPRVFADPGAGISGGLAGEVRAPAFPVAGDIGGGMGLPRRKHAVPSCADPDGAHKVGTQAVRLIHPKGGSGKARLPMEDLEAARRQVAAWLGEDPVVAAPSFEPIVIDVTEDPSA